MKVIENISYCHGVENDNFRMLDVTLPDNTQNCPVFVYFHGGGLENGTRKNHTALNATLAKYGIATVNADYRMFPDAKYPDFIEDAADAVKWTAENIHNYCTPQGIYVGGSSAGGYLSMMLCFAKSILEKRGCYNAVKGYFHDAGQPTKHFNVLKYSGEDSRRIIIDETAPLFHVGLAKSYPPMHFVVSDNDMENRYEQTMLMLSTLKHFGFTENITHEVKHGRHCQYVRTVLENGDVELGCMVADFIKKYEDK